MKICIAVFMSLTLSGFALSETLCGIVRVMHGPSLAAVEPSYTMEIQDSPDGIKQVFLLRDDNTGILRRLEDGRSYCLTGDHSNFPNSGPFFVVNEIREI